MIPQTPETSSFGGGRINPVLGLGLSPTNTCPTPVFRDLEGSFAGGDSHQNDGDEDDWNVSVFETVCKLLSDENNAVDDPHVWEPGEFDFSDVKGFGKGGTGKGTNSTNVTSPTSTGVSNLRLFESIKGGDGSSKMVGEKRSAVSQPEFAEKFNDTKTVVKLTKEGCVTVNNKPKPLFTTPPLTVKASYLGPDGDLGTQYVKDDRNKARFSVSCERGLGGSVQSEFPNALSEQEAFFAWVEKTSRDVLGAAWETKKFATHRTRLLKQAEQELMDVGEDDSSGDKDERIKKRAKSLFLSAATFPGVEAVKLSSLYVNPRTNEVDRPSLWKRNDDGVLEDVTESIDGLVEGSVVVAQMSFRVYKVGGKYGVAIDLGPDLEIVWLNQINPIKRRKVSRFTSQKEYVER